MTTDALRAPAVHEPTDNGPGARTLNVAILGLNYAPEPTGIAPYTTGIAEGLVERGHSVTVFTSFPHYPQWEYESRPPRSSLETRNGVSVRRHRHYVPGRPTNVRRAAFEVAHGRSVLRRDWTQADVVLLVSPALLSSRMILNRVARMPVEARPATGLIIQDLYSAGVKETIDGEGRAAALMHRFESEVIRAADEVAVIHHRFKSTVVNELGADADKVRVIRNWTHVAPTPDFDVADFRRRMGWGECELIVLHTGAMGNKQDLNNVVRAAEVAERRGLPLRFVLLGQGGQRAQLAEAAKGLTQIDFKPPLEDHDYVRALGAADVLLVNEKPEVFDMCVPSKLTSYFSAGRPVLAATGVNSATSLEVMSAGAGICVAPGDPDALVQGALSLGADPALGDTLGARGRSYSETVLSREAAIDAYELWVRDLADQRRARSFRQTEDLAFAPSGR